MATKICNRGYSIEKLYVEHGTFTSEKGSLIFSRARRRVYSNYVSHTTLILENGVFFFFLFFLLHWQLMKVTHLNQILI